jgi:hypothetical protein
LSFSLFVIVAIALSAIAIALFIAIVIAIAALAIALFVARHLVAVAIAQLSPLPLPMSPLLARHPYCHSHCFHCHCPCHRCLIVVSKMWVMAAATAMAALRATTLGDCGGGSSD